MGGNGKGTSNYGGSFTGSQQLGPSDLGGVGRSCAGGKDSTAPFEKERFFVAGNRASAQSGGSGGFRKNIATTNSPTGLVTMALCSWGVKKSGGRAQNPEGWEKTSMG